MRSIANFNFKNKDDFIKGPLSFIAGDVRVVVFKNDDSHSIQPCLYSGLKNNSNQSASMNNINAAF